MESSAELKSFTTEVPLTYALGATASAHYKQGDPFFVLTIEYHTTIERSSDPAADDSGDEPEEIADISFQFGVLCELEQGGSTPEITSEEVEQYAGAAATTVLGPYVREYLHDVTMRMGLPPLVIDILPSFAVEISEDVGADEGDKDSR